MCTCRNILKETEAFLKAMSDVDGVFLHTSRCQDSTATRRLIVVPKMQHMWHVHNQCKFPVVAIILIQQRKLCPNFSALLHLSTSNKQVKKPFIKMVSPIHINLHKISLCCLSNFFPVHFHFVSLF